MRTGTGRKLTLFVVLFLVAVVLAGCSLLDDFDNRCPNGYWYKYQTDSCCDEQEYTACFPANTVPGKDGIRRHLRYAEAVDRKIYPKVWEREFWRNPFPTATPISAPPPPATAIAPRAVAPTEGEFESANNWQVQLVYDGKNPPSLVINEGVVEISPPGEIRVLAPSEGWRASVTPGVVLEFRVTSPEELTRVFRFRLSENGGFEVVP